MGQGLGNLVAGLFGGVPGAGATMGTVTNIRAGGQTRVSGALRAVFVLALLLGLGRYVEPIPHAVLAGILMKVGWDIIDWRMLTRIHPHPPHPARAPDRDADHCALPGRLASSFLISSISRTRSRMS